MASAALVLTLSISWREGLPWVVSCSWLRTPLALGLAGRRLRGTQLRGALIWAWLVVALSIASQVVAIGEPLATGRPWSGHLCYLATLATLAGLITVLNARTPGGGAWAILMGLLVVVFLIPWLEGPGLRAGALPLGRLRLESPWNLFFGLLVLAGTTNFLPTRFGAAAFWLVLAFSIQYAGLGSWVESREARAMIWSLVPWAIAEAAPAAWRAEARETWRANRLERLWFWFRDHWGVVWGLRVLERFNRAAEAQGWEVRLSWNGIQSSEGSTGSTDDAALVLLKGLLRRFATSERLDEAAETGR